MLSPDDCDAVLKAAMLIMLARNGGRMEFEGDEINAQDGLAVMVQAGMGKVVLELASPAEGLTQ